MLTTFPDELLLYISRYLDPIALARAITANRIFSIDRSIRRIALYRINREYAALESFRRAILYNICAELIQQVTKEVLDNMHL